MSESIQSHKQFVRYVVVGIASNGILYLLYLFITWLGAGPKSAMTGLYILGILQTFFLNKNWSFRFDGDSTSALIRYGVIYVLGYFIQFLALMLLVDQAGLPHQWVMAGLIVCIAVLLFIGQKYWVFRQ